MIAHSKTIVRVVGYLAGLAILAGGAYYLGLKVGVAQTLAEGNARVAELTEAALKEKERLVQKHNQEIMEYVQLQESESARADILQARLSRARILRSVCRTDSDNSGGGDPVVRVLSEAVNSPALSKNPGEPFAVEAGDSIEGHHLYCITEYNRVSTKLNTLIGSIKTFTEAH